MDFFKYSKKGQFLIISSLFLILLLIFIYSLETENFYIGETSKISLLDNAIYETCYIGKNSNGTYIENRYLNFSGELSAYCLNMGYVCNLTIVNNTVIPSNESLINYTLFDYSIVYEYDGLEYLKDFTC